MKYLYTKENVDKELEELFDDKELEELFDKYVQCVGKADTVGGGNC